MFTLMTSLELIQYYSNFQLSIQLKRELNLQKIVVKGSESTKSKQIQPKSVEIQAKSSRSQAKPNPAKAK